MSLEMMIFDLIIIMNLYMLIGAVISIPLIVIFSTSSPKQQTPVYVQQTVHPIVLPKTAPKKKYPDRLEDQFGDYLYVLDTFKYNSTVEKIRETVKYLVENERFPEIALDWFEAQVEYGQIEDNMENPFLNPKTAPAAPKYQYLTEEEMDELCEEEGRKLTEEEALDIIYQKKMQQEEEERMSLLDYDAAHRGTDGRYSRVTAEEEWYYQEQKSMGFPFGR